MRICFFPPAKYPLWRSSKALQRLCRRLLLQGCGPHQQSFQFLQQESRESIELGNEEVLQSAERESSFSTERRTEQWIQRVRMSNRLTSHYLQHKLNPSFVQRIGFKFKLMKVILSNGQSKAASTLNSSNNCKMPINELLKVIHFDAEKLLSKIFDFYLKILNTVQNHNNTSERCIN